MSLYLSIECINDPNGTQSVCLTSISIRHCDNNVYQVLIREEIPLFILTANVWNIRIVEQLDNNSLLLRFDGLPGEQIICMYTLILKFPVNNIL